MLRVLYLQLGCVLILALNVGCSSRTQVEAEKVVVTHHLQPDPAGDRQWFHLSLEELVPAVPVEIRLPDIDNTAVPAAWTAARPFVQHQDTEAKWTRTDTAELEGSTFLFSFTPRSSRVRVAYAPPYPVERWTTLVHQMSGQVDKEITRIDLGDVPGLLFASSPQQVFLWILARQHPAETPGSWVLEGLVQELRKAYDSEHSNLPAIAIAGIVNPPGVTLETYRSDNRGNNLAHAWIGTDRGRMPRTISHIKRTAQSQVRHGGRIELVIDIHAHSTHRSNYAYYDVRPRRTDGRPSKSSKVLECLAALSSDFDLDGSLQTSLGSDTVGGWFQRTVGAEALVLEMSYHDLADMNRPGDYMSVPRYIAIGRRLAEAVLATFATDDFPIDCELRPAEPARSSDPQVP